MTDTITTRISSDEIYIHLGWLKGSMYWGETTLYWGTPDDCGAITHSSTVDAAGVKRSEAYAAACIVNSLKRIASSLSTEAQAALRQAHDDLTAKHAANLNIFA